MPSISRAKRIARLRFGNKAQQPRLTLHMRRLLLIIGLLALLAASVFSTMYLVNHPRRAVGDKSVRVGVEEARQVLSPSELLSPPTQRKDKLLPPGSLDGPEPEVSRPPGYMLAYPEWQTGTARVEAAQAVSEADHYIKPVWSPVGLDIAVTRDDFSGLFLAGPTPGKASAPRLLSADEGIGRDFYWTSDGMSLRARGSDETYSEFLITGERFPVATDPERVFVRDDRIFIRDEDGREKQISGLEDRFTDPVLSTDELKVVFRGRETGLYIGLADGTRVIFVGDGQNPRWLPDSRGVVYDLPVTDGTTVVDGDLWLATVDGRTRTNLTNTPGIVEAWPSVSPNGQQIAFTAGGAIYVGKLIRQ